MIYFVEYSRDKTIFEEGIEKFTDEFAAKRFMNDYRSLGYTCNCFLAMPIADCYMTQPRYTVS